MRRRLILAVLFVLGVLVAAAPADSSPSGEVVAATLNNSSLSDGVVAAALNNSSLVDEVVAATPNNSSLSDATVNEPLCGVSDDAALLAAAFRTEAGHMSYQDWLANPRAQEDVARINDVVDAITPQLAIAEVTGEYDPLAIEYDPLGLQLTSGVIGMTIDHVKQLFLVVVDPAMIAIDGLQRDLSAVSGELNVEVRAGCHSIEEITTARQVIRGRNWHPQVSTATYGVRLDPATATFEVSMAEADREVGNALSEALGEMVDVMYGPPLQRWERLNDGEPHYGGAGIGPSGFNNCTSGFTIIKDGVRGSVSAGHCYNNGDFLWSGPEYYGYATGQPPYPIFDMIRITSGIETYANKIHVDPCCPSVRTVVSDGDTSVGAYICLSGMETRAICGLLVTSLATDFCDAVGCTVSLATAVDPGGRTVGGPGDSGGPVYNRWSNNTAAIRGNIVGGSPVIVYFNNISWLELILGMSVAHN